MPIPLGVLAQAGAGGGGGAAGAYEWLETQVLSGNSTTSLSFSNLNSTYGSTYQHLQLRIMTKLSSNSNLWELNLRFNGDTGNNYSAHRLIGDGSSVTSVATTGISYIRIMGSVGTAASSDSYTAMVIDILDPFETTKNKTIRALAGHSANFGRIALNSGFWNSTSAVTSISLKNEFDLTFASGSRFSLYGMRSS
jgi:hypothetical protein